jgi:hypothetical protein
LGASDHGRVQVEAGHLEPGAGQPDRQVAGSATDLEDLGAGARARPLQVLAADQLHLPLLAMLGALVAVLALALPTGRLTRPAGALLLATYPAFIALVLAS